MNTGVRDGTVLVLCTGNICRSPYLEARLAADLGDTAIRVTSAGTGAVVGSEMDPESRRLLERAGVQAPPFAAQRLTAEHLVAADLVIGATREHIDEAARLHPRVLRTGFALSDLHDLVESAHPEDITASAGATWVEQVATYARSRRHLVGARRSHESGIIDPVGQSRATFEQMAREVEALLPPIIATLHG